MKIEIKNVNKTFKKNNVLTNINLTFETGKIYGISGRNGSGKSVLLKIICGIYNPTTGEVLFDNKNYCKDNMFVPNLRAMIETPSFFPDLTGEENLKLLADIQNKIGMKEIEETLKIVNLYEEKDKKYSEYSLGMKQKLAIAQVLMENPEIMIFDEPMNGIEERSVEKILNHLKKIKKNKIIILSSHIKEDLKIADKIYHFDEGKLKNVI